MGWPLRFSPFHQVPGRAAGEACRSRDRWRAAAEAVVQGETRPRWEARDEH